jgi:ABC-type glycerol-3-phosphate transport system substrate-binding protein
MFNGDMAFKGFPNVPGSGAVFNINGTSLAIASTCENPDAAWSFVRTLLTREYQENYTYGFCTNRELYEENLKQAVGQKYSTYDESTGEVKDIEFTQANADMISDLIENTSMVADYNTSQINDIINEEVAYYFSGEKTAQDVAATIQNRVSIYVNEQK